MKVYVAYDYDDSTCEILAVCTTRELINSFDPDYIEELELIDKSPIFLYTAKITKHNSYWVKSGLAKEIVTFHQLVIEKKQSGDYIFTSTYREKVLEARDKRYKELIKSFECRGCLEQKNLNSDKLCIRCVKIIERTK